jgi:Putative zinc-finger
MTCRRAQRLLAAYRRDDWSPRDRAALGQHLSTCAACRRSEVSFRNVGESVRQLPSITPPPGFREAVFAAIRADEQRMGRAVASFTERDTAPELPVISSTRLPISLAAARQIRKRRAPWLNPRLALVASAAVVALGLLSVQVLPHSGLASLAASLGIIHSDKTQPPNVTIVHYMPDAHAHTVTRALATTGWLVYSAADGAGATTIYAENRKTKAVVTLARGTVDAPVTLHAVTPGRVFWSAGDGASWTLYASQPGAGTSAAMALLQSGAAADTPAAITGVWANDSLALVALTARDGSGKLLRFSLHTANAGPSTVTQTTQGHALADPSFDGASVYWAEKWQDGNGQHSLIWSQDISGQLHQLSRDDTAFAPHVTQGVLIWVAGQHGTLEAQSLANSKQQWIVAQAVDSESVRVAGEMVLWRAGGNLYSWDARTHHSSAVDAQIRTAAWVEVSETSIIWAGSGGSIEVYDIH